MLKVCHLTSAHMRYDVRIFQKECTSLVDAGYEVYLVVNDGNQNEIRNGVHIVSTGYIPSGRIDRMFYSTKLVFRLALEINADIYHFHDPELMPVGYRLKKRGKIVIFDSHEAVYLQILCKPYLPSISKKFISILYKAYEGYVSKRIDAVIIPTTIKGKNIFEGRSKRTVFIDNYPKKEEFYDKYRPNIKKVEKVVCYTGSISHERGITNCVKGTAKTGVKLLLAGKFSSELYHDTLVQLPEYKCVEYRGTLDRDAVRKIYEEASIGLNILLDNGQYSVCDNMSTKIYEYMAMGLPVIMSDFPYLAKVNQKYNFAICVNPENITEISSAISLLINDEELAQKMGENGRKAVQEQFNWYTEERKLIELYRELEQI